MQYLGAGQEGRGEKVRGLKQHVKKLCDFSLGRGAYERDIVKTYTGYRCRPFCWLLPLLLIPIGHLSRFCALQVAGLPFFF